MRPSLRVSLVLAFVAALAGVPATPAAADIERAVVEVSPQYICWESLPAQLPTLADGQKCEIRVGLPLPSQREVTVSYRTEPGTAKPKADYEEIREDKLVIPPGQTAGYFTVLIVPDRVREPEEYFSVVLLEASGAELGRRVGVVVIRDGDKPKE